MKHLLYTLLLVGLTGTATAQFNPPALVEHLQAVRAGEHPRLNLFWPESEAEQQTWANTLAFYTLDSVPAMHYEAYALLHHLGRTSTFPAVRQVAADQLVLLILAKSPLAANAAESLRRYGAADYGPRTRSMLSQHFATYTGPYWPELVRVVGLLDLTEFRGTIQARLPQLSEAERWHAYLVLTRWGDAQALALVKALLDAVGVHEGSIELLYPDLAYTRQRSLVDRVVQVVLTDQHSCASPNYRADRDISCAYLAMELLPDLIAEFPYTQDETGELDVEDYATALPAIRQWLLEHPDYTLKN